MQMAIYEEIKISEYEVREDFHTFTMLNSKVTWDKFLDFSDNSFEFEQVKLKNYKNNTLKLGESKKFQDQIQRYLEITGINKEMRRLESDNRALSLQVLDLTYQLSKKDFSLWDKIKSIFKKRS